MTTKNCEANDGLYYSRDTGMWGHRCCNNRHLTDEEISNTISQWKVTGFSLWHLLNHVKFSVDPSGQTYFLALLIKCQPNLFTYPLRMVLAGKKEHIPLSWKIEKIQIVRIIFVYPPAPKTVCNKLFMLSIFVSKSISGILANNVCTVFILIATSHVTTRHKWETQLFHGIIKGSWETQISTDHDLLSQYLKNIYRSTPKNPASNSLNLCLRYLIINHGT